MTNITIMLALLILPGSILLCAGKVLGRELVSSGTRGCLGVTLIFCFTGLGHFLLSEDMAQLLPPWFPARLPVIYVTGVLEFAAALALLAPRLRRSVGLALIAMLLWFLPVNVYAALHRIPFGGHELGPIYLLVRVPVQLLLVGWIWWYGVRIPFPPNNEVEQ